MNATYVVLPELPSLPLDERKRLPDMAAIYFVLADDTVLYIGQSISLRQRWLAHHRLAQLNARGGCRIAWLTVDDASLLDELERACIAYFNPVLNGEELPDWAQRGDVRIALSVSPELAEEFKEAAKDRGLPVSVLIKAWGVERLREWQREHRELRS